MLYLNKISLFDNLIFKNKDDSYTNNELLKLYLKSEKVEVKNIVILDSTLEVYIDLKNIENEFAIYTLSIEIIKSNNNRNFYVNLAVIQH